MQPAELKIGQYLTLHQLCTCTTTYQRYADQIDPYPKRWQETISALEDLCRHILDPVMDHFGRDRVCLTYGFCSPDLKRLLSQTDPVTQQKRGRIDPSRDQHMAAEVNRNGKLYCDRGGAACDFKVLDLPSDALVEWILAQALPFDSLYFYGAERPIHVSYGPQHKRAIWTFTAQGTPTRRGIEHWLDR
jgi:hypothetical protein